MEYEQIKKMMPDFLIPMLEQQYDPTDIQRILEGYGSPRYATLRVNTLLATKDEVTAALDQAGIEHEPVAWYNDAFIITNAREKMLWQLPIYQEGKIYLQSLSSMLPPVAMQPKSGLDILDMCAAPGGKTTQMAALGGKGCRITACELNVPRAERLRFNLDKQGASNVTVMQEDARRLSEYFSFDQILVDAPCSGSGTLHANDVKLHRRFTEQLVAKSTKAQLALLDKALQLLKPGGTLVYSTCSVLERENESILRQSLARANKRGAYDLVDLRPQLGMTLAEDGAVIDSLGIPLLPTTMEGTIAVCPTMYYEGFFMAKVKRTA